MSNRKKTMVFLAALLCCGTVLADTVSDQLTKIEAETLLLKAREKQLDAQAAVLAKQNDITTKQSMSAMLTQLPVATSEPVVRGVEGIGGTVFATLQLSDGNLIDVQAGDVLPNGMHIVSIAPSNVIVQEGKKRTRLAVYSARQAAINPSLPAPGLNLPLPVVAQRGAMR